MSETLKLAKELRRIAAAAQDTVAMYETVIASLVEQLGGEARVSQAELEEPARLEQDDDPVTGDWIYRTVR